MFVTKYYGRGSKLEMKRNNLEKVEDIATASEVASSGATKFEENEPEYGERNSFDEEHDDRRIFGSKRLASFVGKECGKAILEKFYL